MWLFIGVTRRGSVKPVDSDCIHTHSSHACCSLMPVENKSNARITILELGSRQNMTGMETERARCKCIANALVCQLCWTFLLLIDALILAYFGAKKIQKYEVKLMYFLQLLKSSRCRNVTHYSNSDTDNVLSKVHKFRQVHGPVN